MAALESHLRQQPWGKWIAKGRVAFVAEGAGVLDCTGSFVGAKSVEVALASRLYTNVDGEFEEVPSNLLQGAEEQGAALKKSKGWS